jgi:EAL domain-containing protein (putative c-di-GMP-specific phosphodiesterase class I)
MPGDFRSRMPRGAKIGLLTVALATVMLFAADYAQRRLVANINRQELSSLTQSMLNRAEIAADYAVIKLGELYEHGKTDCGPDAMARLNNAIFSSGSIKDILTSFDGMTCTTSPDNDVLFRNHLNPANSAPARNPRIVLNSVQTDGEPALAVTWNFTGTEKAAALINTESLVFDILPQDFRNTGKLALCLTNGNKIGQYTGPMARSGDEMETFEVFSDRYPMRARISVPKMLIQTRNMQRNSTIELAAVIFALLLGYLVVRGFVAAPDPDDAIRTALQRGEIVPYFQPSYNVRSGEITGFEVLARWIKPDGQVLAPATFIPQIEENGWSDELLETMISKTARSMKCVLDNATHMKFAFNISPRQLSDPAFPGRFKEMLERNGMKSGQMVIEITEREEIRDLESAKQSIKRLQEFGVDTAIDDVGTGHNGLAGIQRLGAAVLKIDKLFVDAIAEDSRAGAMVEMLVNIASQYGMRTVAEGVEKESQLLALAELGVEEAQGYYMCRPVDADAAVMEIARSAAMLLRKRFRKQDGSLSRSKVA